MFVLAVKIDHLDRWNERRRRIATRYSEAFRSIPHVEPVLVEPAVRSAVYQYVAAVPRRDELRQFLEEAGVSTAIHYPELIPSQPSLQSLGYSLDGLPHASALTRRIVSIPCGAELTDEEVGYVISTIRTFYGVE